MARLNPISESRANSPRVSRELPDFERASVTPHTEDTTEVVRNAMRQSRSPSPNRGTQPSVRTEVDANPSPDADANTTWAIPVPIAILFGAVAAAGRSVYKKFAGLCASLAREITRIASIWQRPKPGPQDITVCRPGQNAASASIDPIASPADFQGMPGLTPPELSNEHRLQGAVSPSLSMKDGDGLVRPNCSLMNTPSAPSLASLNRLPAEILLQIATYLSLEEALKLRHASSSFLRVSTDNQVLRDQFRRVGLALPAKLDTTDRRETAWERLGHLQLLRSQYPLGPKSVKVPQEIDASVYRAEFSSDGRFLRTQDFYTSRVFDCRGEVIRELRFHSLENEWLTIVGFSSDGRFLITAEAWADSSYGNSSLCLWDLEREDSPATLLTQAQPIVYANLSPDSSLIFTLSEQGVIRLWNRENGASQAPRILCETGSSIRYAEFSHDGRFLLTAAMTGIDSLYTFRLWDITQQNPQGILLEHGAEKIEIATFPPNFKVLAMQHDDSPEGNSFWDYKVSPPKLIMKGTFESFYASFPDLAPSKPEFAAHCSKSGQAYITDMRHKSPRSVLLRQREKVSEAKLSPDGRFALTLSNDGIRLFDYAKSAGGEAPMTFWRYLFLSKLG